MTNPAALASVMAGPPPLKASGASVSITDASTALRRPPQVPCRLAVTVQPGQSGTPSGTPDSGRCTNPSAGRRCRFNGLGLARWSGQADTPERVSDAVYVNGVAGDV